MAARLEEDHAAVAAREAAAAGREQQLAAEGVQLQQQREELQARLEEVLVRKGSPLLALLHGCPQYAYVLSWPAAAAYTASWHGLCVGLQLQLWMWFARNQTNAAACPVVQGISATTSPGGALIHHWPSCILRCHRPCCCCCIF